MSTYTPISTITLSADAASVTFSGIPQTYTDLILVGNYKTQNNNYVLGVRVGNGSVDTAGNYSYTRLLGYSAGPFSGRNSNMVFMAATTASSTSNSICRLNFQNYANTTTNKTMLSRSDNNAAWTEADVGLWRSTSAITTISLAESGDGGSGTFGTGNILSGSTFTLYGIGSGSPKAFGGDEVRTDGTYWYHIYRSSGLFSPMTALTCDYLVVAGGGGGGDGGGGGGAGGLRSSVTSTGGGGSLESALSLTPGTNYTVTVGAGGPGDSAQPGQASNGSNSIFATITSTGGGGAGSFTSNGASGGSGGGGGEWDDGSTTGGAGTTNQGYAGGNGVISGADRRMGGGGGGAGAAGANGNNGQGGAGGSGVAVSITGTSVFYAGGGGAAGGPLGGAGGDGGAGGGGNGGDEYSGPNGTAGLANTGGGGGGNYVNSSGGLSGGSGIVVVRYAV